VEDTVAVAVGTVLGLATAPDLTVAGRTDAGVHARHQVVHADVPVSAWETGGPAAPARLRGLLPDDVRVTAIAVAPPGFDARFSAVWRRYTYRLCDLPAGPDPLRRHDVVATRRRLDVDAMNQAASVLLGEHDFLAFCRPRPGASTVRRLLALGWQREDELVVGQVQADAFCHHMVRALVGALVAVGEGRRPADWPGRLLLAGERDSSVVVMPPQGLVLDEVGYPTDAELAARAAQSRRVRGTTHPAPPG
jgi:tRNA pseudouridine38-40 synthase